MNRMVVRSWRYTLPNWVYVALSIVRTFEEVFIYEKIDETTKFHAYTKLLEEEDRDELRQIVKKTDKLSSR